MLGFLDDRLVPIICSQHTCEGFYRGTFSQAPGPGFDLARQSISCTAVVGVFFFGSWTLTPFGKGEIVAENKALEWCLRFAPLRGDGGNLRFTVPPPSHRPHAWQTGPECGGSTTTAVGGCLPTPLQPVVWGMPYGHRHPCPPGRVIDALLENSRHLKQNPTAKAPARKPVCRPTGGHPHTNPHPLMPPSHNRNLGPRIRGNFLPNF